MDEIDLKINCSKSEITKILKDKYCNDCYITYEKKNESNWEQGKVEREQ